MRRNGETPGDKNSSSFWKLGIAGVVGAALGSIGGIAVDRSVRNDEVTALKEAHADELERYRDRISRALEDVKGEYPDVEIMNRKFIDICLAFHELQVQHRSNIGGAPLPVFDSALYAKGENGLIVGMNALLRIQLQQIDTLSTIPVQKRQFLKDGINQLLKDVPRTKSDAVIEQFREEQESEVPEKQTYPKIT